MDTVSAIPVLDNLIPVPGFPGYFVSVLGEVYSTRWRRGKPSPPRQLKVTPNTGGYPVVSLCGGSRQHIASVTVHQIVASAFLPPRPSPLHEIRHLDGDVTNPAASNLKWGTHQENEDDKQLHNTRPRGAATWNAKLTDEDVRMIRQSLAEGEPKLRIAKRFAVSRRTIQFIASGKTWQEVRAA